jgi:hypothetical protein
MDEVVSYKFRQPDDIIKTHTHRNEQATGMYLMIWKMRTKKQLLSGVFYGQRKKFFMLLAVIAVWAGAD